MPRFDVTTIGEGQLRFSVARRHDARASQAVRREYIGDRGQRRLHAVAFRLALRLGQRSTRHPFRDAASRVTTASAGLDLSAVKWSHDHRLATYYVEYAVPPRSTQVYYDRRGTCFTQLTPDDIDWDYVLDTRLLHLSGITVGLCGNSEAVLKEAAARAKAAGIPVSFDMNYRSRLWTPEAAKAAVLPLLRDLDILLCGRGDAQTVFGCSGGPEEVIAQLAEHTRARKIVISMSHEGLMGWDGESYTHVPARDVVILDRIGAGDSMVAGVLHGVLQDDFATGLHYGVLCAALSLSQYGDQPVVSRLELDQLLDNAHSDIIR